MGRVHSAAASRMPHSCLLNRVPISSISAAAGSVNDDHPSSFPKRAPSKETFSLVVVKAHTASRILTSTKLLQEGNIPFLQLMRR